MERAEKSLLTQGKRNKPMDETVATPRIMGNTLGCEAEADLWWIQLMQVYVSRLMVRSLAMEIMSEIKWDHAKND